MSIDKGSKSDRGKRGLASSSGEIRLRVAKAGGQAFHTKRGLQGASTEVRLEVARKGDWQEANRGVK